MQRADCYEWITTHRLIGDTQSLLGELPPSIDAVVGIARSGLMPASLVAGMRHCPLYAASNEHIVPAGAGYRLGGQGLNGQSGRSYSPHDVLVVDDTACSGRQMGRVRLWVAALFPEARIWTAVVYATPLAIATGVFDFVGVELDSPHYLEWNYFNSVLIEKAALDFDGILCENCPAEMDDDGERYLRFLTNARPLYLPRRGPVGAIVTSRLEKYRPQTVAWLRRWGVRVQQLIMGPWSCLAERYASLLEVAAWKADVYRQLPHSMFVESNKIQAKFIAVQANKPCLCPATGQVYFAKSQESCPT